ncbi:biotin transporter BioY, partial [Sinorhizobium fredii]|nr:biotin transporter BioY [Sinorhizobium fredii]
MSGLETAIRNALERSERSNAEVRARIYQSARQALENGLKKQEIEDPEIIAKQRHRLEAVIHAIETEERAALKARVASPVVSLADVKAKGDVAGS